MNTRKVARRTETTPLSGDILPPLPAIPRPPETQRDRELRAETMRLLEEIRADQIEQNLRRAVKLVHMAYRRQGPLTEFFEDLRSKWRDLADNEAMPRLLDGGPK